MPSRSRWWRAGRPPPRGDRVRHVQREGRARRGREEAPDVPLWVSFTAVDRSGRNLSGQTSEAFWISIEHARPFLVGVNCSLGATEMRPFLENLARVATTYVSCHPNAGLPNALGLHDEQPDDTSRFLRASPRTASSTSSAAAAAPRPSTSRGSLRRWTASGRAGCLNARSGRGSRVSSRSWSGPTPAS